MRHHRHLTGIRGFRAFALRARQGLFCPPAPAAEGRCAFHHCPVGADRHDGRARSGRPGRSGFVRQPGLERHPGPRPSDVAGRGTGGSHFCFAPASTPERHVCGPVAFRPRLRRGRVAGRAGRETGAGPASAAAGFGASVRPCAPCTSAGPGRQTDRRLTVGDPAAIAGSRFHREPHLLSAILCGWRQ